LSDLIHQLATINHQLFSKDGLNNILTGMFTRRKFSVQCSGF